MVFVQSNPMGRLVLVYLCAAKLNENKILQIITATVYCTDIDLIPAHTHTRDTYIRTLYTSFQQSSANTLDRIQ